MHEFVTRRRVEFADTDMGGIVHFARFYVYMETAEHELLAALGATVHMQVDGRTIGWPKAATSCEHSSPARLGDLIDIRVRVERKGRTSLTCRFDLSCEGRPVARGRLTSVCCELGGERPRPVPIPAWIADQLEEAPAE